MSLSMRSILEQEKLSFKLTPMALRELMYLGQLPCDGYLLEHGLFRKVIYEGTPVNRSMLKNFIDQGHYSLHIFHKYYSIIKNLQKENLRRSTMSLSMGNPEVNLKKQINLLILTLGHLYQSPVNDDLLELQFQSARGLAKFLFENSEYFEFAYDQILKNKSHYSLVQPLLSSMLLLGFLKWTKKFNEREVINLFITSYFKDLGMSLIPQINLDKKFLSNREKIMLSQHANNSILLLEGRISLNINYLKIIKYHHHKDTALIEENQKKVIQGVESILVRIFDTISAMISARPYRDKINLFKSLEYIRNDMEKDFSQEFKLIVLYLKKFFSAHNKKYINN